MYNAFNLDRTGDLQIFSLTLSQLSYKGCLSLFTDISSYAVLKSKVDMAILFMWLTRNSCQRKKIKVFDVTLTTMVKIIYACVAQLAEHSALNRAVQG
jgi:hypothetical protein